jgi:hypothetical protein
VACAASNEKGIYCASPIGKEEINKLKWCAEWCSPSLVHRSHQGNLHSECHTILGHKPEPNFVYNHKKISAFSQPIST